MPLKALPMSLYRSAMSVLEAAEARGELFGSSVDDLTMSVPADQIDGEGYFTVGYDVPGKGFVPEAKAAARNGSGVAANYDPAMRRRDPDCMVIADNALTQAHL